MISRLPAGLKFGVLSTSTMHYIAIDKSEFDSIISLLEKAQTISRNYSDEGQYPQASGYLQGAITSALIHLGVTQEFHTHEGSAWELPRAFTYTQDLSAEIEPELELKPEAQEEVPQASKVVSDIFALSV